jgi:PmbA protein
MMKDLIVAAISKVSAEGPIRIADWRLVGKVVSRQEQYFVAEKSEQLRSVEEGDFALTVYVDGEAEGKRSRGEATATIQPTHTPAEVEAKIRQAVFAASKSKNPWYGLPGPAPAKAALPASGFESLDGIARMEAVKKALYAPEAGADGAAPARKAAGTWVPGATATRPRINSLEIFLSREEKTFLNSRGQSYEGRTWRGYSEFVVDAPSANGPVELFDDIEFSEPDADRLSAATAARLAQVADRAVAIPLPSLKDIPVILSGKEAEEVFAWFAGNATTTAVFMKSSTFALGENVQRGEKDEAVAEPIDLWAEPVLAGLPASAAFDVDGFPLERTPVIQGGVLVNLVGLSRYADWLGQPRRGAFPLFSVSPGAASVEAMRAAPHLEPVMFSDFRLDGITGDFGAEIRLAYWFDGNKRVPVTGGSISGSVSELRASMRRSSERRLATRSLCPVAVQLHGVSITGAQG